MIIDHKIDLFFFRYVTALILLSAFSCKQNSDCNEIYFDSEDISTVKQFKRIKEEPDGAGGYSYSYYNKDLSKEEVEGLKVVFDSKGLDYFISNKYQFYFKSSDIFSIGGEFVIDGELQFLIENDSLWQ